MPNVPLLTHLQNALQTLPDKAFLDNGQLNQLNQLTPPTHLDPNAGVLIVLTDEPSPKLLLTRRSSKLNAHAGEVSFVGGKKDEGDTSIIHTALREAGEEVGLMVDAIKILGKLPMQLSKLGLLVAPIVASIDPNHINDLNPNLDEIARLFWVELTYFFKNYPSDYVFMIDKNHKTHHPHLFGGQAVGTLHTPAWCVDDEVIWGMTGRILANLLDLGFGVKVAWYYQVKPKVSNF